MSTTSAPASAAPSIVAAAIVGDDRRMSRPTAIVRGSKCATYALNTETASTIRDANDAPTRDGGAHRPRFYTSVMERKLATVLFVDIVNSTGLVAASDPEVVRRRVNRFFETVSHCVALHGGRVEKFAGDAVLAAFGVPQAHED